MRIMGTGKKKGSNMKAVARYRQVWYVYHYFTVKNGRYTRRGEKKTYVY